MGEPCSLLWNHTQLALVTRWLAWALAFTTGHGVRNAENSIFVHLATLTRGKKWQCHLPTEGLTVLHSHPEAIPELNYCITRFSHVCKGALKWMCTSRATLTKSYLRKKCYHNALWSSVKGQGHSSLDEVERESLMGVQNCAGVLSVGRPWLWVVSLVQDPMSRSHPACSLDQIKLVLGVYAGEQSFPLLFLRVWVC